MRRIILLAMLTAVAGCATQQKPDSAPVSNDPHNDAAGTDNGRGICIGGKLVEDSCAFAIGLLDDEHEEPVTLLSRTLIDYDKDGHPRWKTSDKLAVPRDNDNLHLEVGSCRFRNEPDQSVVALVPTYDQNSPAWIRARDWAYRVELPAGKFVQLEAGQVDCANTAIDAD